MYYVPITKLRTVGNFTILPGIDNFDKEISPSDENVKLPLIGYKSKL